MRTCFFLGHRDTPESVRKRLEESVLRHITAYGVTHFTVGRYGSFDRMACHAVREAKKRYDVTLSLLLPYHPFDCPVQVPEGVDNTFYPSGMESVPRRAAIVQANRYMIRHSDFLICYDAGWPGNTHALVEAARRRAAKGLLCVENLVSHDSQVRISQKKQEITSSAGKTAVVDWTSTNHYAIITLNMQNGKI